MVSLLFETIAKYFSSLPLHISVNPFPRFLDSAVQNAISISRRNITPESLNGLKPIEKLMVPHIYSFFPSCFLNLPRIGKEMLKDTTFEFEKKRNEPLVYNRNLYVTTIAAMQRINEIKEKREILFWENRFLKHNTSQKHVFLKIICL